MDAQQPYDEDALRQVLYQRLLAHSQPGGGAQGQYAPFDEQDTRNAMMAGMAKAAAGLGTYRGKAPDTSAVSETADRLVQQSRGIEPRIEKQYGMDAKLFDYLSNKQAQKEKLAQEMGMKQQQRDIEQKKMDLENKKLAQSDKWEAAKLKNALDIAEIKVKPEKTSDIELPYAERVKKLPATDKARFDNARMGLTSTTNMLNSLRRGGDRYSLIGDNEFTSNLALFEEALGRMQSGGAISKDEENRFKSMARSALDSPETADAKLTMLQQEMQSRLRTLGFDVNEIDDPQLKAAVARFAGTKAPGKHKSGAAIAAPSNETAMPRQVKQNGHIYNFNPATGKYE